MINLGFEVSSFEHLDTYNILSNNYMSITI